MRKGDEGKKVLGVIVILAIIVSVFGGVVSAEDLSGVTQSDVDVEIETAVGNLSSEELIGEQINKSDNVTTEQLRFNPGHRAPHQCGSEGACRNCDEDNPCLCCDNNYCDSPDPDWHDGCDGNCVWWAWDRACCLWGVGLDFHPGGGAWAKSARDYGYRVSDTPEVGTIADGRSLGHVAWVVGVSDDKTSITVSEMTCGVYCNDCSNPANPSKSVKTKPYDANVFEYIYPLTLANQHISTTSASPGDELTFSYKIKNPHKTRAMHNIRLGARIRTNRPQGDWIDDPTNDQEIIVYPGEKDDYSRKYRIPPDVSSGYYDVGWVIVNPNTDEYQVAEAWVDEKVMYSALYISAQPVLAYSSIFRNGIWYVDTTGNHIADLVFCYGIAGDVPIVGDINQDGTDDTAIYRNGAWHVDTNRDQVADIIFGYGIPGDVPIVGDINQDGTDDTAIYRNGAWHVDTNRDQVADIIFGYGIPGDVPIVGDINQDGTDDTAIYRNGAWHVDTNRDQVADIIFGYGIPGDVPIVGDINQDGTDDTAIYRNGVWHVDTNRDQVADIIFGYGIPGDVPVVGDIG